MDRGISGAANRCALEQASRIPGSREMWGEPCPPIWGSVGTTRGLVPPVVARVRLPPSRPSCRRASDRRLQWIAPWKREGCAGSMAPWSKCSGVRFCIQAWSIGRKVAPWLLARRASGRMSGDRPICLGLGKGSGASVLFTSKLEGLGTPKQLQVLRRPLEVGQHARLPSKVGKPATRPRAGRRPASSLPGRAAPGGFPGRLVQSGTSGFC